MTRAERMSALALASSAELEEIWATFGQEPDFEWIRQPEFASVMVRARVSGNGDAFNLGEVLITRCVIQLAESQVIGAAYLTGRRRRLATVAALLDALSQLDEPVGEKLRTAISALPESRKRRREKTESEIVTSQVDFSMLLRAEAS
ncbi:phosphonate C-P lyase system protein PhnG [Burkholderia cepacia]|uniref:phosphonate C-P lyase system protein PhnG n=1 Tax=Burkholderia cepacia TaxID=292 RepID=UPI002AB72347|nr:phosphonate C-P lyase system protein PhnG [Burkholderia cepacia]